MEWPKIIEKDNPDGSKYYLVDSRRMIAGKVTGNRVKVKTKKAAESRAAHIQQKAKSIGHVNLLSPLEQTDAKSALEILSPIGVSLYEAAKFYTSNVGATKILLSDAIKKWLATKEKLMQSGLYSKISYKTAKKRINHLGNKLGDKPLREITINVFESFLKTNKFSPRTQAGIKSIASEFFKWCVREGWMTNNPAEHVRVRHPEKEVGILTPEQAKKLLKVAKESPHAEQAVPYITLGMFCGLRPNEAEKCTWECINFETNEIRIEASKTSSFRYVPMQPGVAALLKPYKSAGTFCKENWRKRFEGIKEAAIKDYPYNAMRHSFASYWLASHNDRPRLAEIMGNKVDVITKFYRRAIPKREAEKFWGLLK